MNAIDFNDPISSSYIVN